jgi:hypothetical protein
MPALVRLYIRHVLIGYALAAVFTALLLWQNVANLWHLVTHSPEGPLAVGLLVMFNGIVFSGVQFGIAVMRMGDRDDAGGRPRRLRVPMPLVSAAVRAEATPRPRGQSAGRTDVARA